MNPVSKITIFTLAAVVIAAGSLLFVFFGAGQKTWNESLADPKDAQNPEIIIRLVARQSYWTVWYPGKDAEFGERSNQAIDSLNIIGLHSKDKNAWDDVVVTDKFWMPVDQQVKFEIISLDVLHSAYIPEFRMKMDAVPGMMTSFQMVADITTEEKRKDPIIVARTKGQELFNFQLACVEVCGKGHFGMRMPVVVGTMAEYEDWLQSQKEVGDLIGWKKPGL